MSRENWRFVLILIAIFLFAATILSRLIFLTISNYEFYQALAEGQQKILTPATGERGEIFFSNGDPIAINKTGKYVFASPNEVKEKEQTVEVLAQILNLDRIWLLEKLEKDNLFELLKYRLSEEEIILLQEKNLKGVHLEEEIFRYYPQKNVLANVVGFVSADQQGQYGVEGYYDDVLRGEEILTEKERGLTGFLDFSHIKETSRGQDLILTIDSNIQSKAENLLSEAQENIAPEGGEILVLNPRTGQVLALAVAPNFNPNQYSEIENPEIFQNPVVQKIFEPGSVFKPIVMAAGLNEGKITPQTTYVDNGIVQIGGWPIYNYDQRIWGQRTMTEVLEKSINTGAIFVEQTIGEKIFLDYIEKFGLFEKTGIELQGEIYSENLELKKGYDVNFATAAFGQGIEITPIQLARAFSAIANEGKMINPYIVASPSPLDNNEKQVISPKTANQLTAMLVSVVENGFGKAAGIKGYFIAGKTGTAQIAWSALDIKKSGYSDKTIQTFIGFFPAFDPQFLILVKLNDPAAKTAEYSAVPIFRELAKYIIDYKQVPPDYE